MFNWPIYQKEPMNEKEQQHEATKQFADRYAVGRMIADKEKDPVKQQKMYSRLALGVTDFSDLQ